MWVPTYHRIVQNKQQNMWVFTTPGFAGIFRTDCKNRVNFDPAADLGDPAVGTVLARRMHARPITAVEGPPSP